MRQWKNRLLIAIFVGVCFTQAADVIPPEVRRVGSRLACLCKTCRNTVGDCTMLECHYSKPARTKIASMIASGSSDDAVVDTFVKDNGIQALSVPPATGFNTMLGLMPWIMGALGLVAIAWFINRSKAPVAPASEMPQIDRELVDRYRERIEKDTADLD
jgi:cytochrome c-type biogenesis protein CcmH/NrfF